MCSPWPTARRDRKRRSRPARSAQRPPAKRNDNCRPLYCFDLERRTTAMSSKPEKPFTFRFIDVGESIRLELTNATDQALESVEVLTVFLKDEDTPGGGPSQAHIKFETVKRIAPRQGS